MKTLQLDVSAVEVSTFDVEPRTQPEPPQQVKTRCTQCTLPQDCQWTE